MTKNIKKIESCFSEPFAFFPFFFGLSGLIMPREAWDAVGYINIPQITFSTIVLTVGAIGYCLRWYQRSNPRKWAIFVKVNAFIYLVLGCSLLVDGSLTGAMIFLTNLLHCRKEIGTHCVFTKSRKLWN